MKFTKLKLEEIIKKSEEKELLLPNFQRDFVWDRKEKQKDLLASFVFNIPIGSLLILNGEKEKNTCNIWWTRKWIIGIC